MRNWARERWPCADELFVIERKERSKVLDRIGEAATAGANIVCLQELFHGRYPCQSEDHARFDEAEPIPGPTTKSLSAAAKKHGVAIVSSLFERRAAGLYHNTAVIFDADGQTVGRLPQNAHSRRPKLL